MKNLNKIKNIIKEELKNFLQEKSGPAVLPKKPEIKPGEKDKKRNPLSPPKTAPKTNPKAKLNETEKQLMAKIIKKYKNIKQK